MNGEEISMTITESDIVWPDGATEEQKKFFLHSLNIAAKRKKMVHVLYTPSCKCDYQATVLLDRFPMSYKILSQCDICKKGVLMKITEPPIYYIPETDEELNEGEMIDYLEKNSKLEQECLDNITKT